MGRRNPNPKGITKMSGLYESEDFEGVHSFRVDPFERFGPGPLSLYDQRMNMRLADPLAYRPLSEQTSNAPCWDAFK